MVLNSLFSSYFEPSFYDNTFCPLCFTIFDRMILSVLSCSLIHATYHLRVSPRNAIAGVSKVGHLLRAPLSSGVERSWWNGVRQRTRWKRSSCSQLYVLVLLWRRAHSERLSDARKSLLPVRKCPWNMYAYFRFTESVNWLKILTVFVCVRLFATLLFNIS